MVEDLRRYTNKLNKLGYALAAEKLMVVAESLKEQGLLPDRIEPNLTNMVEVPGGRVLNNQLVQKVREIVGPLDDDFSIAILLSPKAEVLGISASSIVPLPGWRELLQSLNREERVRLGKAITTSWRNGLRDIGSIRKTTVEELVSRRQLGIVTARFIKAAFEPQPLRMFDS